MVYTSDTTSVNAVGAPVARARWQLWLPGVLGPEYGRRMRVGDVPWRCWYPAPSRGARCCSALRSLALLPWLHACAVRWGDPVEFRCTDAGPEGLRFCAGLVSP